MMKAISNYFSRSRAILIISIIYAILIALAAGWLYATGIVLVLIASLVPLVIFAIFKYPKFGVIFYLIFAYWIMFMFSIGVNFPLGTIMDGLLALLILGFFISQKKESNWEIYRNPVSMIILIWISYNLLQFVNPTAESRLAWVYTIRSVAVVMLSYFIFSFRINSVQFIRLIIKIWLGMSVLAAIYAIKQEYWGFFPFEQRALDADPMIQMLLFIDGHWRKSSIFSDPVSFSYNMVVSATLCIALAFGPTTKKQKVILGCMAIMFMNVMLYSGTRAAYVLLPAALLLFTVLNFNKKIFIVMCIGGLLMLVLINLPTTNPTLYRFQSAFKPGDDASYNVRKANQKRIQPYIKSHPFGGGLGATGAWGVRFAPYSFLAQFPPDSGYARVAVELGWIGLMLICTLMFLAVKTGIDNYFEIKDPELRSYCLAMTMIVFALCIGNFPQEAFVQFPLNIYFYLTIAIINITLRLDQKKTERLNQENNGTDK